MVTENCYTCNQRYSWLPEISANEFRVTNITEPTPLQKEGPFLLVLNYLFRGNRFTIGTAIYQAPANKIHSSYSFEGLTLEASSEKNIFKRSV